MSRRTLASIFVASLFVLAGSAGYLVFAGTDEVGDVAAIEASLTSPLLPQANTSSPFPAAVPEQPGTVRTGPTVPIRSGEPAGPSDTEAPIPVTLRVASIDVDAPIVATGVDQRTGQMAVPSNVRDVAWYKFGSRPGEVGSAVLAAHVDLAGSGPGVFFDLRDLDQGDIVEVEFSDGALRFFRVEARTVYQKDELPLETVFAREGASVLTLITCGGGFSESSRSYDSNVVVYAVPIPDRDLGPAG